MQDSDRARIYAALLDGLNPEQAKAVSTAHRRVLVSAGAGTGKTHVLARRVTRLIAEGVPAEFILCVTFTRKAASEMRERIARTLDEHRLPGDLPTIRTLHSWGSQLLRVYAEAVHRTADFTIYDETDKDDIVRDVARERGLKNWETGRFATLWKDPGVQKDYADRLRLGNALDFDQIENLTLDLLIDCPGAQDRWVGRYRHVLVDEYQDTNLAQVAIVHRLEPPNLFVVGDARQSVYSFRGAEPATIIEAARSRDYEVIELVTNYRSVPEVVAFANGCVDGDWKPMRSGRPHPAAQIASTEALRDWLALHHQRGVMVGEVNEQGFLLPGSGRWFRAERVAMEPDGTETWETREHHPANVVAYQVEHEGRAVRGLVEALVAKGHAYRDIAVLGRTWAAVDTARDALRLGQVPIDYAGAAEDPWASDDGRALARVLLLALNAGDDNLAKLVAEWGALGGRRFADLGHLRVVAIRERRPLVELLGELSRPWANACSAIARLRDTPPLSELAGAVAHELGVLAAYESRALASRMESLRACTESLARFQNLEEFREWWNERTAIERIEENRDAVRLLTVHAAKGLEWPVVILVDCRDGAYPSNRASTTEAERAEDLRVFYVAVTRARDRLVCVVPELYAPPWARANPEPALPSPFLARAGAPKVERLTGPGW